MNYDGKEMDRVATFIPLESDKKTTESRNSGPNSARLTTRKDKQTLQTDSSDSLNDDVAEYIKTLINTALLQLSGQKQPYGSPGTSETESEEQSFGSPVTSETESEEQPFGSPVTNRTESEEQPFGSPVINETEFEEQQFELPVTNETESEEQPFGSPVTNETESEEQPFESPVTNKREFEEQPLGSPVTNGTEFDQPFGSPVTNETEFEEQPFGSPVTNETESEEQPFGSPVTNETEFGDMPFTPVGGEERGEEYYTPRSDDDKDDTSQQVTQDDFEIDEDNGSLEFALKDLPIQEDPESPVRTCFSAQLIAEIDNTLNTILNLEESADDVDEGYSVDETDSSILIDYNDEYQLENAIAEISYYCNTSKVDEYSTKTQGVVTSSDREEYPMTADMEETFNILLQMTHRSEQEAPGAMYASSLAGAISDDVFLHARFPYLEHASGINLHKSIKTPDVTQVENRPMDTNPLVSSESTDDEDEKRAFVFRNDSKIKDYLLNYDKYKEKKVNEKKSAEIEDAQPVVVEMDKKGARSHEGNRSPVRSVRSVRKRGRIRTFFRRAASSLGLIKTRTWSPAKDDNNCNRVKTDDRIEFMTTSFGGEPGDYISSSSSTLPSSTMAPYEGKLAPASEIGESVDHYMAKSPRKAPKRRCRERLVYNHYQGVLEY